MSAAVPHKHLAVLLGTIRQDLASGELVLEQNDGQRNLFLHQGELVHLRSDVAGEQFGSYLLRRGFLDTEALNQLLSDPDRHRLGVKAVLNGLLSVEERDDLLQAMQEQIMVNALEHAILRWTWTPGAKEDLLSYDLHFHLQHRRFIWHTFQESSDLQDLLDVLESESGWQWEGRGDLLGLLGDLPLTPAIAYALSFFTAGPVSFETFHCLSALEREDAGRLLVTLWALGALDLTDPTRPSMPALPAPPSTANPELEIRLELDLDGAREPDPAPLPRRDGGSRPPPARAPEPWQDYDAQPWRDPDSQARHDDAAQPGEDLTDPGSWPLDMPPCGPRPAAAEAIGLESPPRVSGRIPQAATANLPVPPQPAPPAPGLPVPRPERVLQLKAHARHMAAVGNTIEAIRSLEQAVRLQPAGDSAFEAWLMLGRLRMANPAWSTRAVDALQNAARIRPRAIEPWTTMGEIYHRKGYKGDAATCYRKARALDGSVFVPPDVDLNAPAASPARTGPAHGILEAFRTFLGGRKG